MEAPSIRESAGLNEKILVISALTGGASDSLDSLRTVGVPVPRIYQALLGASLFFYRLRTKTGGDTPNGVTLVQPVDFNGVTNNKILDLVSVNGSTPGITVNDTPAWSYTITTLMGGGATALNGQTGVLDGSTKFTLNRLLLLNIAGSGFQPWVLTAGTDAESEFVVHPVNFHAVNFPYVFKKIL